MNIKKIGLTALAGALVSVSANAAELSVTGGASLGFSGEEKTTKGNGWTMNDGISFAASAEMENGWTVSTSMLIDNALIRSREEPNKDLSSYFKAFHI